MNYHAANTQSMSYIVHPYCPVLVDIIHTLAFLLGQPNSQC